MYSIYKYPPDDEPRTTDTVLELVELMAEELAVKKLALAREVAAKQRIL